MSLPIIGISIGDLNGVGPEIVAKTFSDPRMFGICRPVIFASEALLSQFKNLVPDYVFKFSNIKDLTEVSAGAVHVFNCWEKEPALQPGVLTDEGGEYAIKSLKVAAQFLKDGQLDALVTAPIHKANTHIQDFQYTGHTPFLKDFFGASDVVMLLFSPELRVALATEHIPVKDVSNALTQELLQTKLSILLQTLTKDFGIDKPRIALLGLNPHAGDNGQIGMEEQTVILPVIEQMKAKGHLVFGPYSADAFFARRSYEQFDAVLAMYHDQGLVPFKTLAQGEGVNYTAGLSVIRTSPDHGTAFDIAGRGVADPHSFRQAVFSAIDLFESRKNYNEGTSNPLHRRRTERERPGADAKPRHREPRADPSAS